TLDQPIALGVPAGIAGQLRTEIAAATSGDTIQIAIRGAGNHIIVLDQLLGEIETNKNLTIQAVADGSVTIDGSLAQARIFHFHSDAGAVSETIIGIAFTNAVGVGLGGAIEVEGNL